MIDGEYRLRLVQVAIGIGGTVDQIVDRDVPGRSRLRGHRGPIGRRPEGTLALYGVRVEDGLWSAEAAGLAEELAALRALTAQLRSENARLLRLLELTPKQAGPPGPAQTGFFEAHPGPVDRQSAPDVKLDFFAALFAARTDIYATRWENTRTGKAGWLPAVRGGWRKGVRHEDRDHLPLDKDVLRAHLTGATHVGLYPLLDGDLCWWLAADFDGQAAMLDALAYLKAARTWSVPAALEVSRSGVGAHAWVFFAAPVPAETARRLGTALLREAMAVRGRMDLTSYDRLFPSQDVLPAGGVGNLIAAPLHGKRARTGQRCFSIWPRWNRTKTSGHSCRRSAG